MRSSSPSIVFDLLEAEAADACFACHQARAGQEFVFSSMRE
jgi:hypothetical protein